MGYTSHSAGRLGVPFLLVDEAVFVIPKAGVMRLDKSQFKLLFILDGEITHEIAGLEGRHALGTGDILIAPMVRQHLYVNPNPDKAVSMQVIRIFLDVNFLSQQARRRRKRSESELPDYILHHFNRVVQLKGGIDNEIMNLIRRFRSETELCESGYRHRVRAICTEMIVAVSRKLGRKMEQGRATRGLRSGQIVTAAREYVYKHFSKDISLGEIAWHVGKGEEHLARVFKKETGQSVFEYVRETRINCAKTLLLNPASNLTKIAERCGFQSLSFFSRTFREQVGMPPSQYRHHIETALHSPVV